MNGEEEIADLTALPTFERSPLPYTKMHLHQETQYAFFFLGTLLILSND